MGEMRFVLDSDSWKTDTPKGSLTKAFKATERPPVAFYYDSNRKPRGQISTAFPTPDFQESCHWKAQSRPKMSSVSLFPIAD